MSAVDAPAAVPQQSRAFFVDAPGGCGKTYLFNLLLSTIRARGEIALAAATSGIGALLLAGGRTTHSLFKILFIDLTEQSTCSIGAHTAAAELLRRAKIIVWDEITMSHKLAIEAVNRLLQDIMKCVHPDLEFVPFGGKVVVFGGDFRQTLPVVRRGSRSAVVAACLKWSSLWQDIRKLRLTINMRVARMLAQGADAAEQQQWSEHLLAVGEGRTTSPMRVAEHLCSASQEVSDLVRAIFGDLGSEEHRTPENLTNRGILTPKNEDVDTINHEGLQ